jgi:aminoglycoside phosphotransferase (APT) family kinase protein
VANRHRREVTLAELNTILAAAGIDPDLVTSWDELTDGTFNTAYRIELAGTEGLVLKVAPTPGGPLLTYEGGIMATEVLFYEQVTAAGTVPVPRVVHTSFDRRLINSDHLLMTMCPGSNLYGLRKEIGAVDRARLRWRIGELVAALHRITGTAFGYPAQAVAPLAADWRSAFLAMVHAILADAIRYGYELPRPVAEIAAIVRANGPVLDDVTVPVLVHFDLWDGNILVDTSRPDPTVGGFVDGERAFWGDPVADFVSLALFGDIEDDAAFLAGYRAAGGRVTFDARTRRRLALYGTYLDLLMLVEGAPRAYSGQRREALVALVTKQLLGRLAILEC